VVSAIEKTKILKGRALKERKTISLNELVVIFSNYHFVRDRQDVEAFEKCLPSHCTVGIKYSSSDFSSFKKPEESERFFFDRHGTIFPLSCFTSLLNSEAFTEFVKESYGKYKNAIKKKGSDQDVLEDGEFENESEGRADFAEPSEEDYVEIPPREYIRKRMASDGSLGRNASSSGSSFTGKKTNDPKKIKKSKM